MKAIVEHVVPAVNFLLAVGVGVWVLRWVFRRTRKRATGEPRCPRCNYLVVGLTGDVCPECGTNLEITGVVPGDGSRGKLRGGWALLWTAAVIALAIFVTPALYVGLVPVSVQERSMTFYLRENESDALPQCSWEVQCRGVGIGAAPPVEEIRLTIRHTPYRQAPETLAWTVWTSDMGVGACREDADHLEWQLGVWGVPKDRAKEIAEDLLVVMTEATRLKRVDDFYGTNGVRPGSSPPVMKTSFAGKELRVLYSTGRGSGGVRRPLFTTAPWLFAGFVGLWIAGLRAWVPRHRAIVPLFMYRGIERSLGRERNGAGKQGAMNTPHP